MAANTSDVLNDQALLSERLQLLNHFNYSQSAPSVSYIDTVFDKDRNAKKDLHILDMITLALTTGKPGGTFAAAFDKSQRFTVVLAKDGPVTEEDKQALTDLITTTTTAARAYDVLPFLFSRCRKNIEKRIAKMAETLTAFSPGLDDVIKHHKRLPLIEDELPDSQDYRKGRYSGAEPEFSQIIKDIVTDIQELAQAVDFQNIEHSKNTFVQLVTAARVLRKSRLLTEFCIGNGLLLLERLVEGRKLKQRLAKVCQYYFGIENLIREVKRAADGIQYHWVECDATPLELVENPWGGKALSLASSSAGLTQERLSTLRDTFPDLKERWLNSRSLQIYRHAEIRVLLHLSDTVKSSKTRALCPIGYSKRSCLCCTLWIEEYNVQSNTRWLTSRSHGKACATWALPGHSYNHVAVNVYGKSIPDQAVLKKVSTRLKNTLFNLTRGERPFGDDYNSDDDD